MNTRYCTLQYFHASARVSWYSFRQTVRFQSRSLCCFSSNNAMTLPHQHKRRASVFRQRFHNQTTQKKRIQSNESYLCIICKYQCTSEKCIHLWWFPCTAFLSNPAEACHRKPSRVEQIKSWEKLWIVCCVSRALCLLLYNYIYIMRAWCSMIRNNVSERINNVGRRHVRPYVSGNAFATSDRQCTIIGMDDT